MDQNKTDASQINNMNTTNVTIDNNKKKWKCSQCTYENWPSALKCTICLGCKLQTQKLKQNQVSSNSNNNIKQTSSCKSSSKIKVIKLKDKKNNETTRDKTTANVLSSSSSSNENITESYESSCGITENFGSTKLADVKTNDIYQIGLLHLSNKNHSSSQENIINQSIEKEKWSCNVCTYLNWPKSAKCVQCYTLKTNRNDNLVDLVSLNNDGEVMKSKMNKKSFTNLHEQLQQNLVINANNTISNNRSPCNSPCTVSKTLESSKQTTIVSKSGENNVNKKPVTDLIETSATTTINDSVAIENKKWSCLGCTYQNWPKSQRCVMCNLQRNNNTIIKTVTNNNKSKQVEYHQKLKTYQLQMDRLFLAACQGIVDDDMTHLNLYISANGDLTRYLTSEEVKILNRPNVFTVGLTILHLCYQFKRKEFLMQILSSNSASNSKKQLTDQNLQLSSSTMNLLNALLKQVNKTKFSPCQSCPALASSIIERYFSANLRQRKTPNHLSHHFNIHHRHDHHHLHISPTSSLISLNIQQSTNSLLGNNSIATNLSLNNGVSAGINTQTFFNIATSPSPSPPPSSGGGATSIYYQQSQNLCFYVNECHTFILPNEIDDFSPRIQHILYDELLDREVQHELENESRAINWNIDLCKRLDSRLYPLWNRHSGDCLLDSVLQACYGVFDTDNTLRRIMAESLDQYSNCFKPRWKEHEILMAQSLDYTLDDYQLEQDWNNIIALANQPGSSLEQAHIFALCHIFRRPIIIYSIKYVKSFRGENIGVTHFEGVYLPLIWEPNFCFKSPIALGYTRGHFTALVPLERSGIINYNDETILNNANSSNNETISNNTTNSLEAGAVSQLEYVEIQNNNQIFYLPLANSEGQLLPIHFLNSSELGRERNLLRQYLNLDCLLMPGNNCGLIVAQQRVAKRGILVKQMLDEWLSYYKHMQMKQSGTIEISQEFQENEVNYLNNKSNNNNTINSHKLNQEYIHHEIVNDEDDEENEDEDDDDDDDELDDDEEEEEEEEEEEGGRI